MQIKNIRIPDDEFFREREEVLAEWPTGKEVDLIEAVEYHKSQPEDKNHALKMSKAKQNGVKLIQGPGGADTLQRHTELLQHLQNEGQADILSTWIDALTRNHRYSEADRAVGEAERMGRVVLNGFPIVHYGVKGTRKMTESVKIPVGVWANGPDLRLIAEMAFAGGHTSASLGGSLCAFWSYTSDIPPEIIMRRYQYHYRLEGYYEEQGVPIMTHVIGTVAGLIPPSLRIVPTLIEALVAAEQGVKNIQLAAGCFWGNLAQDVASLVTLRKLGREYLDRFGYQDVQIYLASFHPYNTKFPEDHAQAYVILGWASIVGVLGGAELINFFTIDEGRQIPLKENNAATHRYMRMLLNILKDQDIDILSDPKVQLEAEMTERETRAILERVLELGDGDIIIGSGRAVESGALDQPFATTQRTLNKVLGVRDVQGAVRYLDYGNLPFKNDIVEFHKQKVAERSKKEHREISYDAVIGDIFALSMGTLISRPDWQKKELSITG